MAEDLPTFRYYRDPVGDEAILPSPATCSACGRARGFVVAAPLHSAGAPDDGELCPWCVADGSATGRFGGTFNELEPGTDAETAATVQQRTPGIVTWQDWDWPTHCGDAGVYLGTPSGDELRHNEPALRALLDDVSKYDWGRDEAYMRDFLDGLGGNQVAYLFECPRCGEQLVRWDMD